MQRFCQSIMYICTYLAAAVGLLLATNAIATLSAGDCADVVTASVAWWARVRMAACVTIAIAFACKVSDVAIFNTERA